MNAPITCRMLCFEDMAQMHRSFSEAFSSGFVNMNMTQKAFERRMLHKLHIDFSISPGIFSGDKLVGFVFHTQNNYLGKRTAYNGGTGVIPGFRGRRFVQKMYAFALPVLKKNGIERCVLEVITHHQRALKAYEAIGFQKSRRLKCFKKTREAPSSPAVRELSIRSDIDIQTLASLGEAQPAMGDQLSHIRYNLAHEHVVVAEAESRIIGYIIYQYRTGRISQMAVQKPYRHQGYGTALLSFAHKHSAIKSLTFNNVPQERTDLIGLLTHCGFENQINQYEMHRSC